MSKSGKKPQRSEKGQGSAPPSSAPSRSPAASLSVRLRVTISAAIGLHLLAVFAGPLSGPPPASALSEEIARPLRPYLNATYQNHGYRFFAPMPGPSHLLAYKLELPDGTTREEVIPNLKTQWPRQFYHRHFMLTEQLNFLRQVTFDPDLPPSVAANAQKSYDAYVKSYANHLLHKTGAKSVTLTLRRHYLPGPDELIKGGKLDDERNYHPTDEMRRQMGPSEDFPVRLGTFTPKDVTIESGENPQAEEIRPQ